jgi:uncharacterized integral membrane protein (TIGR00698 family)
MSTINQAVTFTAPKNKGHELPEKWRPLWVVVGIAVCATPWVGPTLGLLGGMAGALVTGHRLGRGWKSTGRLLLQIGVVALGFSLSLGDLARVGLTGMMLAGLTVAMVFILARLLGKLLGVDATAAMLIGGGTAICGGSAIAAMGSAIKASDHPMAVAMGTVFMLNAVALIIFPPIGHALGMSPTLFGEWTGIAIHDISSVVGAATSFHSDLALTTATTVKLSRTLWIIPVTLIAAIMHNRRSAAPGGERDQTTGRRAKLPWFLVAFILASALRSAVPAVATIEPAMMWMAKLLFTLSLFLIGAGIDRGTLARAGFKPIVLGVMLWLAVAGGSLVLLMQ